MNEIQRNAPPPNPPRNHKKRHRKLRILPTIILIFCVIFVIGAGIIGGYTISLSRQLPDWNSDTLIADQTTFLYDNQDQVFTELHRGENRTSIEMDQMPPYVIDLLVANEDARFYKHWGVDVKRVFGAIWADLKSGGMSQGASTITMQVARNVILDSQEKRMSRKIKETLLAIQLERHFSKDEILMMYLNDAFLGGNVHGIQAASQQYFDKNAIDLTLSESATLIGMLPSPNKYAPNKSMEKAINVRDNALNQLIKYKPEYETAALAAKKEEILVKEGTSTVNYAYPWYTDNVISEAEDILKNLGVDTGAVYSAGLKIYTSMDKKIQTAMQDAYLKDKNFPTSNTADPVQSAMAVLDVQTGNIVGLIGGREHTTLRGLNRAVDIQRQPGSIFKPIAVFAPAIEKGYGSGSVVNDVQTKFGANYQPSNYDGNYRGVITARTTLQYSINVASVKFLQKIGVEEGYAMTKKLGMNLKGDSGLSLALGGLSYGVAPIDIAAAYAAFGNKGIYSAPKSILKIEDANGKVIYEAKPSQTVAMQESTAYIITNMLESVTQAGTGTSAQMGSRAVASKTGTTQLPDKKAYSGRKGTKDAWFAAYTTDYVGVVWMGYDQDQDADGKVQYLKQVYGGKYPASIWKQVMTVAHEDKKATQFPRPDSVKSVAIDSKSGLLPSELTPKEFIRTELFAEGSVPDKVSDVWQQADICTESGKLATSFCPNTASRLRFTPPVEPTNNTIVGTGGDHDWVYNATICPLHGTKQEGSVSVSVCTDPLHKGELFYANLPVAGQTGGCPAKYVKTKNLLPTALPTDYCSLDGHELKGTATEEPTDPTEPVKPKPDKPTTDPAKSPSEVSASSKKVDDSYTVTLSWIDDYNEPGALYEIERWEGSDKTKAVKLTTYFRDIDDKKLKSGTTYHYRVRCNNKDTNQISPWSTTVSITLPK